MATPSQSTPQPSSLSETISPDSIDTLPVLSALLSRLETTSANATTASTAGSPPAATPTPSQLVSGTGPLRIKDIPAGTDELKHKLQKARAQVKELPDIHRSVADQEQEIRELEERITRQRSVLEGLRDVGVQARREREEREREGGKDVMETT
jgi:hypothetical protein